jgi:hypothetical protein
MLKYGIKYRKAIYLAQKKSVRRKSTRMPVTIQRILLKYLGRVGDDVRGG